MVSGKQVCAVDRMVVQSVYVCMVRVYMIEKVWCRNLKYVIQKRNKSV
jgi:hypothetical protein